MLAHISYRVHQSLLQTCRTAIDDELKPKLYLNMEHSGVGHEGVFWFKCRGDSLWIEEHVFEITRDVWRFPDDHLVELVTAKRLPIERPFKGRPGA